MLLWILSIVAFALLASNLLLPHLLRIIGTLVAIDISPSCSPVKSISVIIPAYNEEANICNKLDSLWSALQQVASESEVIIGSDGSTDRTVAVASDHISRLQAENWRVAEFPNEGKCSTINRLVDMASGDIIISTDADILVPEDAIRLIVRSFEENAKLGCLSCIPELNSEKAGFQKSYWSLEDRIRDRESALGHLIVVTGWLYAFRKKMFVKIPQGVMADDFWIPLSVLLKGYHCIQEHELKVCSEATDETTEVKRRKRVICGGMDVIRRLLPQLVKKPLVLLLVLMHKVNRWAAPLWIALFIGTTLAIWPWIALCYIFGGGLLLMVLGRQRFLAVTYTLIAPISCFVEVMFRKDFARWEPTRKHDLT